MALGRASHVSICQIQSRCVSRDLRSYPRRWWCHLGIRTWRCLDGGRRYDSSMSGTLPQHCNLLVALPAIPWFHLAYWILYGWHALGSLWSVCKCLSHWSGFYICALILLKVSHPCPAMVMRASECSHFVLAYRCQEIGLVAIMFFFELLFSYVSSQFTSMFLLPTYSQSFFFLSADYPRHPRRRRSKIQFN